MRSFLQKLFGNNENSKPQKNAPRSRKLQIESLENREMLSISTAEFNEIRAMYPDLNLSTSMSSYNVIEITAAQLSSDTALRNAINTAETTPEKDLIVVRTTAAQNKITLGGSGLTINITSGSVTLVSFGTNSLTIDANGESQVFRIDSDANIALAGLTITGGFTIDDGGGIYNEGTLTVINCKITDNMASYSGGGIANLGTLTVIDSEIADNYADSYGGGIYNNNWKYDDEYDEWYEVDGGTLTVTNSIITGNMAYYSGGGIWSEGTVTITSCEISKNALSMEYSASGGGGICNYGELTLLDSTITYNIATAGGGLANHGLLTITGGEIYRNQAYYGGGICSNGEFVLMNGAITENLAYCSGGGIYNWDVLTVTNSTITGNRAEGIYDEEYDEFDGGEGGGIFNGGVLTVTNSTIADNSAYFNGGGIYNREYYEFEWEDEWDQWHYYYGVAILDNTIVSENSAAYGGYGYGGGICNAGGMLTVTDSEITENALVVCGGSSLGGGIYNGWYDDIVGTLLVTGSKITSNQATYGGGICNSGELTITSSEISENCVEGCTYYDDEYDEVDEYGGFGGGILNWGGGTTTITKSKILENSAYFGGGIVNYGELTVANSAITNNRACCSGGVSGYDDSRGGGMYNEGTLALINSTISGNTAAYGSGIYNEKWIEEWYESNSIITLYNTILAENDGNDVDNVNGTIRGSNNLTTFTGWTDGTANLVYNPAKPLFVNAANGNYRLAPNSQAINKGNNAYAVGTTDLDGKSRIVGGTVDIGAYEYQGASTVLPTAIINNAMNLSVQQGCSLLVTGSGVDPLGKGLTYLWDFIGDGDFREYSGNTAWFTADFPGGNHVIRLKVRDANGNESEVAEAVVSILKVMPTYGIHVPDELVAGRYFQWEFEAVASFNPIRDWEINWGDGSQPTQIHGGPRSRVSAWHLYRETGNYTITISTTDFDGIKSTVTYAISVTESVEVPDNPLPTVFVASGGILKVNGTKLSDWIEIEETATQILVHAFAPNHSSELEQWSFAKNTISTIEFYGDDGDDTFKNFTSVNDVLDGGDGNNMLLSGKGTTTLKNTGNGSNCFAINGNSVQWADGSSLGKKDSLILFATVDRYGDTSGWYYSPNDIRYVAWSTANINNVLSTVSRVYKSIGNYGYFRNNNTGNGEIYMMVTDSYSVLGSVYGYNDFGDMVYRENGVNSRLTIHEIGHNWDSLLENPFFDEFAAVSYNGNALKPDAVAGDFAFGDPGNDGKPYEDWAYTISLVFDGYDTDNQSTSAPATAKYLQKADIINRFGEWLGGGAAPVTASVYTSDRYAEFWISGFDSTLSYKLYHSDASGNKGADTGATLTTSWLYSNFTRAMRVTGLEPVSTTYYLLEATNREGKTVSSGVLTATTVHGLSIGDPLDLSGARTLDNETINWNALLNNNRYIVVVFAASWCGYSEDEIDYLLEYVYDTYKPKGLEIVTAYTTSSETLSGSKAQVAEKGIPWINITDHYLDISYRYYYAMYGVPTTVVIDCSTGRIINDWVSAGYLATLNWNDPSPTLGSTVSMAMPVSREIDDPGLAETMRQRQMLDLDQSGQKFDRIAVTELVWSDDEMFDEEWFDFSVKRSDFWNDVFENNLLAKL